MRWPDAVAPVRMRRVALVAPAGSLRDVLVAVADAGTVEIDRGNARDRPGEAARRLQHAGQAVVKPALAAGRPGLGWLERAGRYDLLAGEAQLEGYAAAAVRRSGAAALAGWIPAEPVARYCGQGRRCRRGDGPAAAAPRGRGTYLAGRSAASALADAARADVRDGALRRHRPDLACLGGVCTDVRHDVRRRRAGRAAGRDGRGPAGRLAAPGPPVPAGLAVRWWGGTGRDRLRAALRGVLRANRTGAGALAGSAQPAGHPAAGRGRHWRDPARRGVCARHDQPVAGRRLASRAVRTVRHRRHLPFP